MGKFKLFLPLILLAVLIIWAVPAILKAMPDRYVARLPEPLQKIGFPENDIAILPTAANPQNAIELINSPEGVAVVPTIEFPPTKTPEFSNSEPDGPQGELTAASTQIPTIEPPPTITPQPTPTPWPIPSAARLNGIQHQFQEWNNCGPATLAMALTYFGMNINQQDTAAVLKPNPEDRNVSPHEMADFVNNHTDYKAIYRTNGSPEILHRFIANGIPVIIEVGIEPPGEFRWMGWYGHYLLVVAYDDSLDQFWVYDSWFGTSEEPLQNANPDGRVLSYAELEQYWPQFNYNYIALFKPDQFDLVSMIIGKDTDNRIMWQDSLKRAQNEIANDGNNPFLWFNLGTSYNALGQYQEAATAFDQARAIGLPWRMLWYQFGPFEAYQETGRYEDVLLLADVTLKDRPYFEEAFYYKGLALQATGDDAGAVKNFELAKEFNPNYAPAVEALSEKG